MEKGIREAFGLKAANPARIPTLSLAYLGDAVFEVVVRTVLLEEKSGSNGALFARSLPYVSAVGQAKMTEAILPLLDEEEAAAFRRGKNAKPEHGAKMPAAGSIIWPQGWKPWWDICILRAGRIGSSI